MSTGARSDPWLLGWAGDRFITSYGENMKDDASGFVLRPASWAQAVEESDYIAALEDLRIVFVDDMPPGP